MGLTARKNQKQREIEALRSLISEAASNQSQTEAEPAPTAKARRSGKAADDNA